MRKKIILTLLLFCLHIAARGQTISSLDEIDLSALPKATKAKALRYWYNDDGVSTTTIDIPSEREMLDVSGLIEGLHTLHLQLVDENGNFVETVNTYDEIVAEPTEEEVAELQEQLKREKEEAARQKEEAEKAAAEKAAEEKAAEERAKERAEAEQEAIEKQKAAAGEKPTESSTETTSKPSEPTETEVGTPQEDGAGDYTEDVSSEEEGAATAD